MHALLLAATLSASLAVPLTLHTLNSSTARCLDGSRAGYYYRPGKGSTWVIYLEGGGACYTYSDCLARTRTPLGSSTHWPPTFVQPDNVLSDDAAINPVFAAAHALYVPYCGGDVHRGTRTSPLNASWPFTFAGHLIVEAVLDALVGPGGAHAAAFAAAAEVLVSGSSAGGLGTLLNSDYIASRVPAGVRVRAAPQGGFFFPRDVEVFPVWEGNGGNGGPDVWEDLAFASELYQGYNNPACIAAYNASYCDTVDHAFRFTRVPTFIAENLVDSQQVSVELLAPPSSPRLPAFLAYFHAAMVESLRSVDASAGHAVWAPGCLDHTGNLRFHGSGNATLVGGWSFRDALNAWWVGDAAVPRVLIDACTGPIPCNPTCTYQ